MTTLALKNVARCKDAKCHGVSHPVVLQFRAGPLKVTKLECGHSFTEHVAPLTSDEKLKAFTWNGGKKLFDPFQIVTLKKTEENDGSLLNLNEMGLGKMVTSVASLVFHSESLPALVVCKARLKRQWFEHIVRMSEKDNGDGRKVPTLLPAILDGSNARPYPEIFSVTIVSYDTLWRIVNQIISENKEKAADLLAELEGSEEDIPDALAKIAQNSVFAKFKTIILDEFQLIKNPSAKRTKGIRLIGKDIPKKQLCSGTPTKNDAREFFVPLNFIRPDLFPKKKEFEENYVEFYFTPSGTQKALGIKKSMRKEFDSLLEPFTVRYTRKEAMPSLPPVFRQFEYIELVDKVKEAYKRELRDFENAYAQYEIAKDSREGAKDIAARWGIVYDSLMKLKRIVGLAKAEWLVQEDGWLEEFLTQTDRKIVIAHHHIEAGLIVATSADMLCKRLSIEEEKIYPAPIHLHGGLSENQMWEEIKRFKENPNLRVLILRQLAEGEGINLQECGDLVQLERQWNPANEKQVEDRFPRPGTVYEKINVLYPVALGTVDEFLASTVERKRYAADNTYGEGSTVHWMQSSVMQDVAKMLFDKGLKPWGK